MATALQVSGCGGSDVDDAGPVVLGAPSTIKAELRIGEPYTYGEITIFNMGNKPATLLRVSGIRGSGRDLLRGFLVAGEDRSIGIGLGEGFPPKELAAVSKPLRGAIIAPYRKGFAGTQLLIGAEARRAGRYVLDGFTLHYEAEGRERKIRASHRFEVCAPRGKPCKGFLD